MKSFDQFNYSNSDLPESENLDEESLEELFGQIRKAGKLVSRMARSSNSGGKGSGPNFGNLGKKVGGFLTNPTVRMAGSAINQGAKAFKREFASQPKISSVAPGTGFGMPFGGVAGAAGAGIKGAVTKGQTFDKNTTDKKGNVQLGKKAGSILSRARSGISKNVFGATPVRDQNKEKKDGKVPVTTDAERKKPKSQTPASADATKSRKPSSYTSKTPEASKSSALVRRYNQLEKTPGTPEYQVAQDVNKFEKNMKVKAGQESETTGRRSTGSASPEAKQNFEKVMSNAKRLKGSSPNQPRLTAGNDDIVDNSDIPVMVRGGIASAERQSKMPTRSVGNKQDDADFEKYLSTQPKPRITGSGTSSSIVGKKPEAKTNTRRRSAQRMTRGQKLRSKADEIIRKLRNEEFSHWREEFLWEVDKKYPDKVKEIKPMSGKNTIIINPEDETSKYKRGY